MKDAVGNVSSILVLGGTSEIGLAIARRLVARRPAAVTLAGRDAQSLDASAETLRAHGATEVTTCELDLSEPAKVPDAIDAAFADRDHDVVILAAGVLGDNDAAETDPAAAAATLTVNGVGAPVAAMAVANRLEAQGHGTLVVLSTVAAVRARRANYVYGASKAALDSVAQGLQQRLAGSGANAMIVRPGFVKTKMTDGMDPAPFSVDADEVAEVTVAGLDKGAALVWAPAPVRAVATVFRLLPQGVLRRLPR